MGLNKGKCCFFVAASVPLAWVEGTSPSDSYDSFKGDFFKK